MNAHDLSSFGIATFDPVSRRPARAGRTATRSVTAVPASAVEIVPAESAEPTAAETEAALLRAEVAGLREIAATALAEANSAREVADSMQRAETERRRLEALRTAPRITLLDGL